jgi:small subunit ribosomal protein S7
MGAKNWTASVATLKPDPVYSSLVLSKFINCIMYDGKKATAQRVVYGALDIIAKKVKDVKPIEVFDTAINNIKPMIETKSRRVGGQNYQVPVAPSRKRQQALAFRWLIEAARSKTGKPMYERLSEEILAASRREGAAMTMRENVHKMAEANRAFAHFAW